VNHSQSAGSIHTNSPPSIQLVEPDGENDTADAEFMITWIDSDTNNDAAISLFYLSDPYDTGGTLIASRISEDEHGSSGSYIWDTAEIPEGIYYIRAVIDDGNQTSVDYSQGFITIEHSETFNEVPNILILTPEVGADLAHESYIIKWVDSDPDDDAKISLYHDSDQKGLDGVLIASDISENDETDYFTWDTKNLQEGEYYIYAVISDGVNPAGYDYSNGFLRIDHTPGDEVDGDEEELTVEDQLPFIILALILLILYIIISLKGRRKSEGEEEPEEEFEKLEKVKPLSSEELEDEEIDMDLLPPSDELN
jgi:hypothetical protein